MARFCALPWLLSASHRVEWFVQVGKLFGNSETEAKGTVQEKKGDAGPPPPPPRPPGRSVFCFLIPDFWFIVHYLSGLYLWGGEPSLTGSSLRRQDGQLVGSSPGFCKHAAASHAGGPDA